MKHVTLLACAGLALAACSTSDGGSTTAALVPTTPTPTTPTTPVTPTTPTTPVVGLSTTTATSGDSLFLSQNAAGAYVLAPATAPLSLMQTNGATRSYRAHYDLTVGGVTYALTDDPANTLGGPTNKHTGSAGGNTVSLFLNEDATHAIIANPQFDDGAGGQTEYFVILGTPTDPAALPTATARYAGMGEISIDSNRGIFDDAPASTVTMDVDFAAGTLSGQFDVVDPAGENGGTFDIDGNAVLPMTGTVTANTFTADVDYADLVATTNGLNSVNAQPVTGSFFGPNGEEAVGIGISTGTDRATNDVMIYTRIQATQQ